LPNYAGIFVRNFLRYTFRLERVLTIRNRQREQATLRHAEARKRLEEAEQRLDLLTHVLEATMHELDRAKHANRLNKETLHYHTLHCAGVKDDIKKTEYEVAEANVAAERTAAELLEAHRAAEVLEKLREKDFDAWKEQEAKKEMKQMDEVAVTRHRMKEENHGP